MDGWKDLCREHAIELIEDCAQSHLSCWDGVTAGAFGTAGTYSFYPTKNLGAIGDGGAVVTHRSPLAERISQLRNYGQSEQLGRATCRERGCKYVENAGVRV